jgi:hypothetical protein
MKIKKYTVQQTKLAPVCQKKKIMSGYSVSKAILFDVSFVGVGWKIRKLYTLFFILVSGLWEIFSRQVEFRDFWKFQWKSALVVVEKYSNITIMYLQRRRKVFLFIIFQVKLLMIMIHTHRHRDITSNVSSSHCIVF